jgi:hypothetical protein
MAFAQGIQTINQVAAAGQVVTNSVTPVDVTGFSFLIQAGKKIYWEVDGAFSTAATGGFRFLAHNTSAPTLYIATFSIIDITTAAPAGTPYNTTQTTEAAFTNASAVATNYILSAKGIVIANAATTFSFQFAQNNAQANNITILGGTVFKLWQL